MARESANLDPDMQAAAPMPDAGPRSRYVLMVLYFFPPLGGVSMSRNVRNVQYLPRHGWSPVVLAPRNPGYHLRDPGSAELIPAETRVIRTSSLEAGHVRPIVVRAIEALRDRAPAGARNDGSPASDGDRETEAQPASRPDGSRGWMERVRRLLFFPDDQVGWLPFALVAALRAHRDKPFDAIYSTSSPITAHLVAGFLKRLTGLPWVAEFRDPWLGNVLAVPPPWFHRRLQVKLERWIVNTADRVVGVSPGITALYRTRYPSAPEMATITSGYDRSEARAPSPRSDVDGTFRVVYTGTLDRPVELRIFLEGLYGLVGRRPDLTKGLRIDFYGSVSDSCRSIADRLVPTLGRIVTFHGFVARGEALDALAGADAALILLGPGSGMGLFIGGKLFDYIGQNRQILAMLPPGDSRNILAGLDWGVVCDPEPSAVERAIERLLTLPPPDRPADPAGRFDRFVLAGELARCLDEVVSAKVPSHGSAGDWT